MFSKIKWFWLLYFSLFTSLTLQNVYNFFAPGSPQLFYFRILCRFDNLLLISYFATFIQIILNIIHCLPIALYALRIRLFKPKLWQILLILRLIFDIIGHPYAMNYLAGFYYDSLKIFAVVLFSSISIYIPSYWVCYKYAFKGDALS